MRTFLVGLDIAQIGVAGVVGITPLAMPILDEEFLRQVPALNRRIERIHQHARTGSREMNLATLPLSQAVAIIGLGAGSRHHQQRDNYKSAP